MNEKDATIIKALAELGLHKEHPLTPEQEKLFQRAINPEEDFLQSVEELFHVNESDQFSNQETTLEHLHRILMARSKEFQIYLQYLSNKYPFSDYPKTFRYTPNWDKTWFLNPVENFTPFNRGSYDDLGYWLSDGEQDILTPSELAKVKEKLHRLVITAKMVDQYTTNNKAATDK